MKTHIANPANVHRRWLLIDAEGQTLGRLAAKVATLLKGKHKPIYAPHMDVGDNIIIINAQKIHVTGKKAQTKRYYRHTGYPGGLRSDAFSDLIVSYPERILEKAIWGMLPHNHLGRKMFKKLKVYANENHPHKAQKPEMYAL